MEIHTSSIQNIELSDFSSASKAKTYLASIGGRNYELNENLFQLISLLKKNKSYEEVAVLYSKKRNKPFSSEEVEQLFSKFILPILTSSNEKEKSPFYFTKKIASATLVYSFTKYLKVFFTPIISIFILSAVLILNISFLIASNLTILPDLGIVDLLFIGFLYFISVIFHELGHASAISYFGIKPGHIGVGLYLNMPVFYADVSDAWRLSRTKRVIIDLAGIYFQLIFLLPFLVLEWVSPNPLIQLLIFSINISFLFDLNPFFKFDGYWVFSDWVGIPNLRKRTQDSIIYFIRRLFNKKNDKPPYILDIGIREKILMITYSLLANLFFCYYMFFRMPQFLADILKEIPKSFHQIFVNGLFEYSIVSKFLFQLLFLFISIYFLFRISITIFKQLQKIVSNSSI